MRQSPASSGTSENALRIVVAMLAFACAIGLARALSVCGLKIVFDYNEGWNAYHAAAAMSGTPLYPGADSLMFNNYPPLSFYIVGAVGRLIGDYIVAGRLLSILAAPVIGLCIGASARVMGCSRTEATFAGLLLIATLLVSSSYIGINDPQLLAHAFGCTGFFVVLKEPRRDANVIFAALLLTLAGFIKHMLIMQPIVLAAWLAIYDRPNAKRFVFLGVCFTLLGLVFCKLYLGVNLLERIASARGYELNWVVESLEDWSLTSFFALIGTLLLFRTGSDKYAKLCAMYALLAVLAGGVFAGGAGVGTNALFDANIAIALGAGVLINRLQGRGKPAPLRALGFVVACTAPLAIGLMVDAKAAWLSPQFWFHPDAAEVAATNQDIAFLESHPGPALCEMLALCYWAGKQAPVDAFNLSEALRTHARSEDDFVDLIDSYHFRVVELDQPSRFFFSSHLSDAFKQNYRIDHGDSNGQFLLPKPAFGLSH